MKHTALFLTIFLLTALTINAQSVGKLFKKTFADTTFGKVKIAKTLSVEMMEKFIADSTDALMFKVTKDELIVLNKNKQPLFPPEKKVDPKDYFFWFTKDKIKELLAIKADGDIMVEMRNSTITLTYGEETLEQSSLCPPFCP